MRFSDMQFSYAMVSNCACAPADCVPLIRLMTQDHLTPKTGILSL